MISNCHDAKCNDLKKKNKCSLPCSPLLQAADNYGNNFWAANFSLEPRFAVSKAGVAFSCDVRAGTAPPRSVRPLSLVDPVNLDRSRNA